MVTKLASSGHSPHVRNFESTVSYSWTIHVPNQLYRSDRTTRHVHYCRQRFRSVDHLAAHCISIWRLNGCSNNIQHAVQFSWLSPPVCGHQNHAFHGDQHAFSYNSVWLSSILTIITAILGQTVYSIHHVHITP